jgi:hypothetical protein
VSSLPGPSAATEAILQSEVVAGQGNLAQEDSPYLQQECVCSVELEMSSPVFKKESYLSKVNPG